MTKKESPVDLENLFFFLHENPFVSPIKKDKLYGEKEKSDDEIERGYYNNIKWKEKGLFILLKKAATDAKIIRKKISWSKTKKRKPRGLEAWM